MKPAGRDLATGALVGLVAAAQLIWLARITPFNMGDEGYLFYIAWRVQTGARLFQDIELFTYAPGLFQLWAGWFDAFGTSVASGRALGVVLAILNVVQGFAVARMMGARALLAAAVAGVLLLSYPWLFRGQILLLSQLALLCALLAQRGPGRAPLAGLGALVIIGAAVRIDAAGTAGALALAAVLLRLSARPTLRSFLGDVAVGIGGAVAAAAVVALIFLRAGVLDGWLDQLAGFAAFAHSRSVAWYKTPFPMLGGPERDSLVLLMLSAPAWPLIGLVAAWRRRGQGATAAWQALALLSLFALMNLPQFLIERPDGAHFADRAFAWVLLLAGLIGLGDGSRIWRVVQAGAAVWLAVLVFWAWDDIGTLQGEAHRPALMATLAGETVPLPNDEGLREALLRLDRQMAPTEPLASLPFAPGANFLLKRPMPSPQVNFFPFNQQRAGSEQALRAGLASPTLRYALVQPEFQMSPDPRANLGCYAPGVMADLAGFRRINTSDGWWLLEKGGRTAFPARDCRSR